MSCYRLASLLFALSLWGCHERPRNADSPAQAGMAGAATPAVAATAARSSTAGTTSTPNESSSAVPAAASAAPTLDSLPKLKPILKKPFPEGADEATVCEAVDSKETDPWTRFGHIVPAYVTGAIYVLEAGPEAKAKLKKFIEKEYVHPHFVQQASCRSDRTLLYLRSMFSESEYQGRPFGRVHLSGELEKRLGIKTLESFQFEYGTRLSDYCRADAEVCEALVKLDVANENLGLCVFALTRAGADVSEAVYGERCKLLEPKLKACAYVAWTAEERSKKRECACQIRRGLGIAPSPACDQ